MWLLLCAWACDVPTPRDVRELHPDVVVAAAAAEEPEPSYAERKTALESTRTSLAARYAVASGEERAAVVKEAREAVLKSVTTELFPAWYGTPWEFYGTTETPGEGTIACGYFVSTVLRDAGFRVERVKLAQQASEHILLSFTPSKTLSRFSDKPVTDVVAKVAAGGESLWIVGLDYHVGFLWNDGSDVWMCHSSYLGAAGVVCEDAATSPAMESRYRVVGRLLADDMMDAWLQGKAIPTWVR